MTSTSNPAREPKWWMSMRWLVPAASAMARRLLSEIPSARATPTTAASSFCFGVRVGLALTMYQMVHEPYGTFLQHPVQRAARSGVAPLPRPRPLARDDREHHQPAPPGYRPRAGRQRGHGQAAWPARGPLARHRNRAGSLLPLGDSQRRRHHHRQPLRDPERYRLADPPPPPPGGSPGPPHE